VRQSGGVLLVALVLAVGAVFAIMSRDATPPPIAEGQVAPAFALPSFADGAPVRLEEFRGRVVLLNFWATWCKPCEDEMPSMERLHLQLEGKPFALLAVSVDAHRDEVKVFRDRLELTLPILLDPEKKVANAYQAFRFPETILIDAQGKVAGHFIGPRDWSSPTYLEKIQALVDQATGG